MIGGGGIHPPTWLLFPCALPSIIPPLQPVGADGVGGLNFIRFFGDEGA
jgi:hypothetical protein